MTRVRKKDYTCLNIDDAFFALTNNFDATFFLLIVENLELPFLLPVVKRADDNLFPVIIG